jgi:hypothetical protein
MKQINIEFSTADLKHFCPKHTDKELDDLFEQLKEFVYNVAFNEGISEIEYRLGLLGALDRYQSESDKYYDIDKE